MRIPTRIEITWLLCSRHSFHEPEYMCSRLILIIKKMWGITRKVSRRKRVCYPATRLRSDPAWEGSGFCIPYNLVTFPDGLYSIWVILQRNQVKSPEARCQVMRNPGRDAHPIHLCQLHAWSVSSSRIQTPVTVGVERTSITQPPLAGTVGTRRERTFRAPESGETVAASL